MAKDANVSKAEGGRALDSFTATTTKVLRKGSKLILVGFGTFSLSKRKASKGRNPQTGETIKIKAKKVMKFSGSRLEKVGVDGIGWYNIFAKKKGLG